MKKAFLFICLFFLWLNSSFADLNIWTFNTTPIDYTQFTKDEWFFVTRKTWNSETLKIYSLTGSLIHTAPQFFSWADPQTYKEFILTDGTKLYIQYQSQWLDPNCNSCEFYRLLFTAILTDWTIKSFNYSVTDWGTQYFTDMYIYSLDWENYFQFDWTLSFWTDKILKWNKTTKVLEVEWTKTFTMWRWLQAIDWYSYANWWFREIHFNSTYNKYQFLTGSTLLTWSGSDLKERVFTWTWTDVTYEDWVYFDWFTHNIDDFMYFDTGVWSEYISFTTFDEEAEENYFSYILTGGQAYWNGYKNYIFVEGWQIYNTPELIDWVTSFSHPSSWIYYDWINYYRNYATGSLLYTTDNNYTIWELVSNLTPITYNIINSGSIDIIEDWVSISLLITDFNWYYEWYLTDLTTWFLNYTWNKINFSSGVLNNNLDDTTLYLTEWHDYTYTIYMFEENWWIENPIEVNYNFSVPYSFIDSLWTYELTSTWFILNDVLIYNDWDYSFSIFDDTNWNSLFKWFYSFSSWSLTNIEVEVYEWEKNADYYIFSNIDITWLDTFNGPDYYFNLQSTEIFDTTVPDSDICDLDSNWDYSTWEALMCPFTLFKHYTAKVVENVSKLKNFFVEIMRLGTDEVKTFSFIPSANASNILDWMQMGDDSNILTWYYTFIKSFLIFVLFVLSIALIIYLKRG